MSWSIPSAKDSNGKITKYEVVLYKPTGEKETYVNEEKTLSKDISGLETNQQYYVGVRAYTRVGPGPYSNNLTYSSGIETNNISNSVFHWKHLSNKYLLGWEKLYSINTSDFFDAGNFSCVHPT